ncbi:unnamed protein product [Acanthoscelides obtectus]|uniref:Peptidase S1 domain-containing protein n=1 Tax=Acanthoscelides obtectus TaxID=200917 RepID=A0A9P0Q1S9_ACAOB|nr:unnamed protein product [Acanthoscelides obtectus]CAK1671071.1 Trypsin-4 [Acanthoscelides obtectus]
MCTKLLLLYVVTCNAFYLVAAIAGGHNSTITRHQGAAYLQRNNRLICGAAIISSNWLLTSAKCVGVGTHGLTVHAGSGFSSNGTSFQVEKVIVHPDYKQNSHDADLALLYVNENVTDTNFTRAFLLPCGNVQEIPEGAYCHLIDLT